jgi:hypothetical protein
MNENVKQWILQLPDYYKTKETFERLAELDAQIILLKREIEKAEDLIVLGDDKPRSNEARKAKILATSDMKDHLAQLEAERVKLQWVYEFIKVSKDVSYAVNTVRYLHKTGAYGEI